MLNKMSKEMYMYFKHKFILPKPSQNFERIAISNSHIHSSVCCLFFKFAVNVYRKMTLIRYSL